MDFAGIKVPDTALVHDAMDLSRSLLEPFLFNHVMRSWLFGIVLAESAAIAPDAELLAVAAILHDLGLTERYNGENRFEVDGANAAREFLKERGISAQQTQLVWDAIALHTTPTLALHKEKNGLKECLCNIARRKPESTFDNIVRDFGVRYVEGYTSPNFADVVANAPFSE